MMREFISRFLAKIAFWQKPQAVNVYSAANPPPPKYIEIIGEEYLADYQQHYRQFQGRFLSYVRANGDGHYWSSMSFETMAHMAGDWARTEYGYVPDHSKIRWWMIGDSGIPVAPPIAKFPRMVSSKKTA